MGWRERARATQAVLRERAKETGRALDARLDGDTHRSVKAATAGTASAVRDQLTRGRDAALARAAESERAAAVGAIIRRGAAELAGLPVVSVVGDVARARSGTAHLLERCRAEPGDPLLLAQLAEALARMEGDMAAYRALRAVVAPHSVLVRGVARSGAALGQDELPARRSLEVAHRAALLGAVRVRRSSDDGAALHALARAALVEQRLPEAGRLATATTERVAEPGAALVTLARAQLLSRHLEQAQLSAQRAVDAGCTVGFEVLAELSVRQAEEQPIRAQMARYEDILGRVSATDYGQYYGVERSGGGFARTVLTTQRDKMSRTSARVTQASAALRDRLTST